MNIKPSQPRDYIQKRGCLLSQTVALIRLETKSDFLGLISRICIWSRIIVQKRHKSGKRVAPRIHGKLSSYFFSPIKWNGKNRNKSNDWLSNKQHTVCAKHWNWDFSMCRSVANGAEQTKISCFCLYPWPSANYSVNWKLIATRTHFTRADGFTCAPNCAVRGFFSFFAQFTRCGAVCRYWMKKIIIENEVMWKSRWMFTWNRFVSHMNVLNFHANEYRTHTDCRQIC